MRLNIFTLALDALPWLPCILAELNRLTLDWRWVITHGAAAAVNDTAWMRNQPARLSQDGTSEFLRDLENHPRITVTSKPLWTGKTEMCNEALKNFDAPGVLLQCDSDELWSATQMTALVEMFKRGAAINTARFRCRYFVGPNLITDGVGCYGNKDDEWTRAWRWQPGQTFSTHEPPVMNGNKGGIADHTFTASAGMVFDHYAWATRKQAAMKQWLYGPAYNKAVDGWIDLQQIKGREPLRKFFGWADGAMVTPIF